MPLCLVSLCFIAKLLITLFVMGCFFCAHAVFYEVYFLHSQYWLFLPIFCAFPPTIPFLSLQDLLFLMTSFAQLGSHYHLISSCSFCTVLHQLISASTHFCAFWSSWWRLMTGVWSWFAGMMSDWEDRWLFWNDVWCKTLDVCVCSFLHILQRKSFVLRWFTCRFIF